MSGARAPDMPASSRDISSLSASHSLPHSAGPCGAAMADGPAHPSGREADSLSPEAQRWFHAVKAGDLLTVAHMLHCAGHTDVARRALTEQRCDRGATALCWAAMHGHVDVARALLNAGADTEARDYRAGGTPLVWGAAHNQVETIRLLLESGHAFAGRSTGAPAGAVLQHVVGGDWAMPPPPWSTVRALTLAQRRHDKDTPSSLAVAVPLNGQTHARAALCAGVWHAVG